MCTEEFIRMMFTVDLYGNRGLDSRTCSRIQANKLSQQCTIHYLFLNIQLKL